MKCMHLELPSDQPSFITQMSTTGNVVTDYEDTNKISGNILMIANADPGYDWIFSHGIAGFITMYGGTNSHMAIRSSELQVPAVIGAGEKFFRLWSQANALSIDCANNKVRIIN